jgi:hypothetical protein
MPNFCFSKVDGNFATWPNVNAPSAASERWRFLPMPESSRTERSFQKFLFLAGFDFDEAGLGRVRRELGEPRGIGEAGGHGNFHLARNPLADFLHIFFRRRVSRQTCCPSS